jgi:hypothetical protein
VFGVVDALDKLENDPSATAKLSDAVAARQIALTTMPLPKGITDEHLQHRLAADWDAVATNLKIYLKIDDELLKSLAELATQGASS